MPCRRSYRALAVELQRMTACSFGHTREGIALAGVLAVLLGVLLLVVVADHPFHARFGGDGDGVVEHDGVPSLLRIGHLLGDDVLAVAVAVCGDDEDAARTYRLAEAEADADHPTAQMGLEHLLGETDGHLVVARILGESASELSEGVGGIETQPSLVAVDLVGLACLLHALSARQGDGSGSLRTYHGILGEGCERREGQGHGENCSFHLVKD